MAMCLICDQLGQVILHTRLSAAIAARTPAKRQNRKVAGSTYGIAIRAITKPVLQMRTKIGAIALSSESFMGNLLKILRFFTEPPNFRLFSYLNFSSAWLGTYAAAQHLCHTMVQREYITQKPKIKI